MTFDAPIPFLEAIEKLAARGIVPSGASSKQWREVEVWLRERAFFSSRVESARVLTEMQKYLVHFLEGNRMENGGLVAQGRAEFVADMRELAIREGLGRVDPLTGEIDPVIREGDLTDVRSLARLQLIFDTQTESAMEFGYWQQGQDEDILYTFPAQQFVRVRPVKIPRPYHEAAEGIIVSKGDVKFWTSLNRDFGVPWGPWGFNSGMGVEDVDREEAIAVGAIRPDEVVKPQKMPFNEGLSASIRPFEEEMLAALRRVTGGAVAGGRLMAQRLEKSDGIDLVDGINGELT